MKWIVVVVSLFISGIISGQELTNFYLEPGSTANEATLHTSFYYSQGAGLENADIEIVDNVINATLCYKLSSTLEETYDDQQFTLNLPSGYTDFVLNVNLVIFDYNIGMCDYMNVFDSGTILFDYPYLPTEKTFVPDDSFEGFLELNGNGDDIPTNDEVFTYRIENMARLEMSKGDLYSLGLDEIEVLTGIVAFKRLKVLHIYDNLITDFNATRHPSLTRLFTKGNPISSLDLTNNPELQRLWIGGDNIEELDLSQNENLILLWVRSSNLTSLNLIENINLNYLDLDNTLITELDISQNINLERLRLYNTLITELDATNNSLLKTLNCRSNLLTSLTFNSDFLSYIDCSMNQITNLDLSSSPNLQDLIASNTPLTSLDIRDNPMLKTLFLSDNNLTSLDLRNGNNENFYDLSLVNNLDLTCVSVDDPAEMPYPNWVYYVPNAFFSADCSLGTNDVEQLQAVIYPNPVREILTIESKEKIKSIQVYSMLGELLASENGKSQVDFSTYVKGIYFLKIDTEKGSVFQKVLKE